MIYPDEEKVTYDYNLGGQVDHVRGYKSYGYDYVNSESSGGNTGTARFSLYVSPYLVAGQGSKHTKHILHFRAWRKSFPEWFEAFAVRRNICEKLVCMLLFISDYL